MIRQDVEAFVDTHLSGPGVCALMAAGLKRHYRQRDGIIERRRNSD